MEQVVTITQQGQLTIPKAIRSKFGIQGAVKAFIRVQNDDIVVRPQGGFWALSGTLKSQVTLTDAQLKKSRDAFSKEWARKV